MKKIFLDTLFFKKKTPFYQKCIGFLIWVQLCIWGVSILFWILEFIFYLFM